MLGEGVNVTLVPRVLKQWDAKSNQTVTSESFRIKRMLESYGAEWVILGVVESPRGYFISPVTDAEYRAVVNDKEAELVEI